MGIFNLIPFIAIKPRRWDHMSRIKGSQPRKTGIQTDLSLACFRSNLFFSDHSEEHQRVMEYSGWRVLGSRASSLALWLGTWEIEHFCDSLKFTPLVSSWDCAKARFSLFNQSFRTLCQTVLSRSLKLLKPIRHPEWKCTPHLLYWTHPKPQPQASVASPFFASYAWATASGMAAGMVLTSDGFFFSSRLSCDTH